MTSLFSPVQMCSLFGLPSLGEAISLTCIRGHRLQISLLECWSGVNIDQSPSKQKYWPKFWLVQTVFYHCSSHMKIVLSGGCGFICFKCFCNNARIIKFFNSMVHTVNQTHLQLRLVNSSTGNCCDGYPLRPIMLTCVLYSHLVFCSFWYHYKVCTKRNGEKYLQFLLASLPAEVIWKVPMEWSVFLHERRMSLIWLA